MSELVHKLSPRSRIGLVALTALVGTAGVLALGSSGAGARGTQCEGEDATTVLLKPGTFTGGPENEVIVGSAGPDTIHGRAGNDIICSRSGDDLIGAGSGNDDLIGGNDDDLLRGRRGIDFMDGDEEPNNTAQRGKEFDECHGHLPKPDVDQQTGDTATGCEQVVNAIDLDD